MFGNVEIAAEPGEGESLGARVDKRTCVRVLLVTINVLLLGFVYNYTLMVLLASVWMLLFPTRSCLLMLLIRELSRSSEPASLSYSDLKLLLLHSFVMSRVH